MDVLMGSFWYLGNGQSLGVLSTLILTDRISKSFLPTINRRTRYLNTLGEGTSVNQKGFTSFFFSLKRHQEKKVNGTWIEKRIEIGRERPHCFRWKSYLRSFTRIEMKWAAGAAKMAKPNRSMERGGVSPCVWPHLIFSVEQQKRIEEEKNRGGVHFC